MFGGYNEYTWVAISFSKLRRYDSDPAGEYLWEGEIRLTSDTHVIADEVVFRFSETLSTAHIRMFSGQNGNTFAGCSRSVYVSSVCEDVKICENYGDPVLCGTIANESFDIPGTIYLPDGMRK